MTTDRRAIQGIWLIERGSGRNLVARAYSGIEIDMDLIAPFLSATHTFIDKASNESLKTIDTEHNRYIWEANEYLLFVMVVSKSARIGHMRFILEYALEEFMRNHVPEGADIAEVLKNWHGVRNKFKSFGVFLDELIGQYEETDERLLAGKSMDCLEVYSHLFRAMMRVNIQKKARQKLVSLVKKRVKPLLDPYPFIEAAHIDSAGIEVLSIDIFNTPYRCLREALEELLRILAQSMKETVTQRAYRSMVFNHAMPYVKRDLQRLQTYAILDDVIRHLF